MKGLSKTITIALPTTLAVALLLFILAFNSDKFKALTGLPDQHINIENKNSDLLNLIVQPNDLSDKFQWSQITKSQKSLPVKNNQDPIEKAFVLMTGYYRGYGVGIINIVEKYSDIPAWNVISGKYINSVPNFSLDIQPALFSVKLDQISKCGQLLQPEESQCFVLIQDSNLVITIEFTLDQMVDKTDFEEIVNPILQNVKAKLSF